MAKRTGDPGVSGAGGWVAAAVNGDIRGERPVAETEGRMGRG
ncbi:MAG: hypothetical protein ACK5ZV_09810 [bacterium]